MANAFIDNCEKENVAVLFNLIPLTGFVKTNAITSAYLDTGSEPEEGTDGLVKPPSKPSRSVVLTLNVMANTPTFSYLQRAARECLRGPFSITDRRTNTAKVFSDCAQVYAPSSGPIQIGSEIEDQTFSVVLTNPIFNDRRGPATN